MAFKVNDIKDAAVRKMIKRESIRARAEGVKIDFTTDEFVDAFGSHCSGYFDGETLAVATGGRTELRIGEVFAHESCHMDQWLERSPFWVKQVKGFDTGLILDMWLQGVVDLSDAQKAEIIMPAVMIERDCERRTLAKLKKAGIDTNFDEYAQQANAYVYFYHMVALRRRWYPGPEKSPPCVPEVWRAMPKHFEGDYASINPEWVALYDKHIYS